MIQVSCDGGIGELVVEGQVMMVVAMLVITVLDCIVNHHRMLNVQ